MYELCVTVFDEMSLQSRGEVCLPGLETSWEAIRLCRALKAAYPKALIEIVCNGMRSCP
jgi:hypothetical protein